MDILIDQGLAITMGLAMAATCGLRAFLPLLVISILAVLEKVTLGSSFTWMTSPAAIVCFSTAVIAEVVGDKVPVVDHALDVAGLVVKPTAAAVAVASMITEFDPLLALVLGMLSGGVAAEVVHLAKAKVRLLSSAMTATLANPVISLMEDGLALLAVVLAILVPVVGIVVLLGLATFAWWMWRRHQRSAAAA